MTSPRPASRFSALLWWAVGLVGLVVAVDGALRGEPRHRVAAVLLGLGMFLPAAARGLLRRRAPARLLDRLALSALALLVGLGALETAARALDLRAFSTTILREDPVLGYAHEPWLGGLDGWGFRNPAVPGPGVDVVCLGDSQTFGENLPARAVFARRLAVSTGSEVYNMSAGGWGPLQYLALAERAMELQPDHLVVALYLGNDAVDAFRFARLDRWAEFRLEGASYPPLGGLDHGDHRSLNLGMALIDAALERSRVARSFASRVKLHLRVLGVTDRAAAPTEGLPPAIATAFDAELRASLLDPARRPVRHGLDVTEECLRRIGAIAAGNGSRAHVLLLATKEGDYARYFERRGAPVPDELARVLAREREVIARLRHVADEAGLGWIDPTEALVGELVAERPVFPRDSDGHFAVRGAAVIADVLGRALGLAGS